MKTFQTIIGITLLLSCKVFASSAFDPMEYIAPKSSEWKGVLSQNTVLQNTQLIGVNKVKGPEGLAFDPVGNLYTGTDDGSILKIDTQQKITLIGNTRGRALGLCFHPDGRLIIADMSQGLLAMDTAGNLKSLSTSAEGRRFGILDDVDVASDGKIYFSEATYKYDANNFQLDVLEARPNGRLLVYDPATGESTVLIRELYFANGVALSKDEDFVLVAESGRYQITRYWLKGERAGAKDIFAHNLPGFPDNLSHSPEGDFWVAMVAPRNSLVDWLHQYPTMKKLVAKLPKAIWAKQEKYGLVLKINSSGRIDLSLHDPNALVVFGITAVEQFGNSIYLGTYENNWIGKLNLNP